METIDKGAETKQEAIEIAKWFDELNKLNRY